MTVPPGARLTLVAPDGIPEIQSGADLVALIRQHCRLADGDIVLITSKVVSKAEGRTRRATTRDQAIDDETERVVARRGDVRIVRHRLGLTMAAAGVDASNVAPGTVLLLPEDPDATARAIRTALAQAGVNVGVLITDTAGRAWRVGQTDLAIGAAGVTVAHSFAGQTDPHGNPLVVTEPAVADELAGAAELASGKLGARPLVVATGRADLVLPAGEHGPGARALIRDPGQDLFGYGSRESVLRAATGEGLDGFGPAISRDQLDLLLDQVRAAYAEDDPRLAGALALVARAHGWPE